MTSGASLGEMLDTVSMANQAAFLGDDPKKTFREMLERNEVNKDLQEKLVKANIDNALKFLRLGHNGATCRTALAGYSSLCF